MVRTADAKTSFQEMTNANMADAVMPGKINGKTTYLKAPKRVQPSVQAASSSSLGIPENSENVIRMANGSASVVCISDKPICVSSRPVSMNRTANGNASNGKGKARVIRIMTRKNSFPTKSNRESAYPAGAPSPIEKIMVKTATMIEFNSASIMPLNFT